MTTNQQQQQRPRAIAMMMKRFDKTAILLRYHVVYSGNWWGTSDGADGFRVSSKYLGREEWTEHKTIKEILEQ